MPEVADIGPAAGNNGSKATMNGDMPMDTTRGLEVSAKEVGQTTGVRAIAGDEGTDSSSDDSGSDDERLAPHLTLDEQPKARGFRFRYGCEGPSHGGITGENSERGKRTFPTVTLHNCPTERARIVASLICSDDPLRPHAHSLVGKNVVCGQAVVEVSAETGWKHIFSNLGILHVTKKNAVGVLTERYALALEAECQCRLSAPEPVAGEELPGGKEALRLLDSATRDKLRDLATEQATGMNLSNARLCFQAFLQDKNGDFSRSTLPVISQVIYDSKSPASSALKICRMHRNTGTAAGGDEIYILCDRVQREDIQVKFCAESSEHEWEADGIFSPSDVHRQSAIVVKTPPYRNQHITSPVHVTIRLKRRSGDEMSEGKLFTYTPVVDDLEEIGKKRKKAIPRFEPGTTSGQAATTVSSGLFSQVQPAMVPPTGAVLPSVTSSSVQFQPTMTATQLRMPQVAMAPQSNVAVSAGWVGNPGGWGFANMAPQPMGRFIQPGAAQPMFNAAQAPQAAAAAAFTPMFPSVGGSVLQTLSQANNTVATASNSFGESPSAPAKTSQEDRMNGPRQLPATAWQSPSAVSGATGSGNSLHTMTNQQVTPRAGNGSQLQPSPASKPATSPSGSRVDPSTNSSNMKIINALNAFAVSRDLSVLEGHDQQVLHLAVASVHKDVTGALLKVLPLLPLPDLNSTDAKTNTMLHLSVTGKRSQLVAELLRLGADMTVPNSEGNSCVHLACQGGNTQILQMLLISNKARNNGPTSLTQLDGRNYNGKFPAHLAVQSGSRDCLQILKNHGFSLDSTGGLCGSTPLHNAVSANQLNLATFLLSDCGVSVNAKNYQGSTALHLAAEHGHRAMVSLLLRSGAVASDKNSRGKLPANLTTDPSILAALQGQASY